MRARKKKWAPAELAGNPLIIRGTEAPLEGCPEPLNLRAHFNNDAPIHVEIGCGKGRFIAESARRRPDINFLGIERETPILAAAARRGMETRQAAQAAGEPLPSLAFLLLDVTTLAQALTPGEIARLYINFCDPWPRKKKWAKRRLTHGGFLRIYEALNIPEIHFKTDNRLLFEFSIESFSENNWLMKNVSLDLHNPCMPADNIVTEYEEKFSKAGPIYRLEAYNAANLFAKI